MKYLIFIVVTFVAFSSPLHAIDIIFTNSSNAKEFSARKDNRTKKQLQIKNLRLVCVLMDDENNVLERSVLHLPEASKEVKLSFRKPKIMQNGDYPFLRITLIYEEHGGRLYTLTHEHPICNLTPKTADDCVSVTFEGATLSTTLDEIHVKHHHEVPSGSAAPAAPAVN